MRSRSHSRIIIFLIFSQDGWLLDAGNNAITIRAFILSAVWNMLKKAIKVLVHNALYYALLNVREKLHKGLKIKHMALSNSKPPSVQNF